jgi:hypothetical protein
MLHCPHCYSRERIYRSPFHGLEFLSLLLLHRPYRCDWCQTRFFALYSSPKRVTLPERDALDSKNGLGEADGQAETAVPA